MNKTHTQQPVQPVNPPAGNVTHTTAIQPSQSNQSQSAALPPLLVALALVSIVLLIAVGGALFCFPEFAQSYWVWPLKPFNTRFLGAIYLSSLVGLASLVFAGGSVFSGHLAIARLIVPMMWVFTTIVLMVSCLQLQQFNAGRRATDIWFWLYLLDCVGSSYYCGYFRTHRFSGLRRLPALWSGALSIQAGVLGAYGLSLLFSPAATGAAWLWPLDVFHAQLYSAIFLAGAVGSALLSRRATVAEARTLGAVQITFSSLVLLGIWLVDKDMQRLDWGLFVNWAWVGAIALLGLVGLGLIRHAARAGAGE